MHVCKEEVDANSLNGFFPLAYLLINTQAVAEIVEHAVVSPFPKLSYALPSSRMAQMMWLLPKYFGYVVAVKLFYK